MKFDFIDGDFTSTSSGGKSIYILEDKSITSVEGKAPRSRLQALRIVGVENSASVWAFASCGSGVADTAALAPVSYSPTASSTGR